MGYLPYQLVQDFFHQQYLLLFNVNKFNQNPPSTKDPGLGGLHINMLPECMGDLAFQRSIECHPFWGGLKQYRIYKSMTIFKGICRKITMHEVWVGNKMTPLAFVWFCVATWWQGDYEITNYRKILCNLPGDEGACHKEVPKHSLIHCIPQHSPIFKAQCLKLWKSAAFWPSNLFMSVSF